MPDPNTERRKRKPLTQLRPSSTERFLHAAAASYDRRALDALDYEARPSAATLETRFIPGSYSQSVALDRVTEGVGRGAVRRDTRLFLLLLLSNSPSAVKRRGGDGFVPFSSRLMRRVCRRVDWRWLEGQGLIAVRGYSRAGRRSREFHADPEFARIYFDSGLTGETVVREGRCNVVTGLPTARAVKSRRRTPSDNPLPPIVRAAIDAPKDVSFDLCAAERSVTALRDRIGEAEDDRERARAEGRYLNDVRALQAVLNQRARPIDPADPGGLWRYDPAYRMVTSGRIAQVGGGLQSISRATKEAAYAAVPGARNYDLRSSQLMVLLVFLGEAGIDGSWLAGYVADPDAKRSGAEHIGVPVDAFKQAVLAVVMGARVPTVGQARRSEGAVATAVRGHVAPSAFSAAYRRFLNRTAGLVEARDAWHRWLTDVFVPETGRRVAANDRTYVKNETGATVAVEDLAPDGQGWRMKSRLAAFLLQGREARFAHELAAMSAEFGYRVLSPEHDGLVVQGTILQEAVTRAAESARLPPNLVAFVEKPIL